MLRFLKWWQKGCEIWREIAPKMVEPWAILMKWPLGSKFGLPKLGVYCSRWNGKDSSHAEKNLGHFSLNFTESAAIGTSFFFIEKPLIFNKIVPLLTTSRSFPCLELWSNEPCFGSRYYLDFWRIWISRGVSLCTLYNFLCKRFKTVGQGAYWTVNEHKILL